MSLVRSPGLRLVDAGVVCEANGYTTPSGCQSPQLTPETEPVGKRQLASRNACGPPLFCVRQMCWNPVNCVSGFTRSNVRN